MKVAVVNFSGNVGKSTLSAHLLKPRLLHAPIFSVESINADSTVDGVSVEQVRARGFSKLMADVLRLPSAVVDVGASNVEEWFKLMRQHEGSKDSFDVFVVPVVKERKSQADTINTVKALSMLGVEPDRIRLVFNKVDVDDSIELDFEAVVGMAQVEGNCHVDLQAVVYANEVFEMLKAVGRPLCDIASDETDYRGELRHATDEDERARLANMFVLRSLAKGAVKNLDQVHDRLLVD